MKHRFIALVLGVCLVLSIFSGCVGAPAQTTVPTAPESTESTIIPTELPEQTQASTEVTEVPVTEAHVDTDETEEAPEYNFVLSDNSVVLTEKGQRLNLYCGDVPVNEISWMSADESIALFSQGIVVALDKGVTVVYAKYRDNIIFCEVVCDVNPEDPSPYVDPKLLDAPRMGIPYVENPDDN